MQGVTGTPLEPQQALQPRLEFVIRSFHKVILIFLIVNLTVVHFAKIFWFSHSTLSVLCLKAPPRYGSGKPIAQQADPNLSAFSIPREAIAYIEPRLDDGRRGQLDCRWRGSQVQRSANSSFNTRPT